MLFNLLALLPVVAVVLVNGYDHRRRQHQRWREDSDSEDFDYFKLTLIYPPSVCRADDAAVEDVCKVPENAAPWTIHGLWPNRYDGSYPQFCGGKAAKFDLSKLAPIEQELEKDWPNLFPKRSVSSLWKHEWEKHGTCAEEVPDVSGEVKYFNKSLALHDQIDIFGVLKSQGIVPSTDQLYNALQLRGALQSAFGKNVELHCLRDRKTKEWLLADVRLCLSKDFQPMDCERRKRSRNRRRTYPLPSYQPCPADNILYVPLNDAHGVGGNAAFTTAIATTTGRKAASFLLPLYNLWHNFRSHI